MSFYEGNSPEMRGNSAKIATNFGLFALLVHCAPRFCHQPVMPDKAIFQPSYNVPISVPTSVAVCWAFAAGNPNKIIRKATTVASGAYFAFIRRPPGLPVR